MSYALPESPSPTSICKYNYNLLNSFEMREDLLIHVRLVDIINLKQVNSGCVIMFKYATIEALMKPLIKCIHKNDCE